MCLVAHTSLSHLRAARAVGCMGLHDRAIEPTSSAHAMAAGPLPMPDTAAELGATSVNATLPLFTTVPAGEGGYAEHQTTGSISKQSKQGWEVYTVVNKQLAST